jgi:hypothetical protein
MDKLFIDCYNKYSCLKRFPTNFLKVIEESGGNTVEINLHNGVYSILKSDSKGYVTDEVTQTSITDLLSLLDEAANHNIIVIICLWRDVENIENNLIYNLFEDDLGLDYYFVNVLIPILVATSHHEALGAWSIIYNPQKIINWSTKHDIECFDTQKFSFLYFTKVKFSMEKVLRFINLHSSIIHNYTKKLVTTNVWNDEINSNYPNCFNYFKDECLQKAGTESNGKLDFYSLKPSSDQNCLIRNTKATDLLVDKLIVISGCEMDNLLAKKGEIYKQAHDELYAGITSSMSSMNVAQTNIPNEMRVLASTEVKDLLKISIEN